MMTAWATATLPAKMVAAETSCKLDVIRAVKL